MGLTGFTFKVWIWVAGDSYTGGDNGHHWCRRIQWLSLLLVNLPLFYYFATNANVIRIALLILENCG